MSICLHRLSELLLPHGFQPIWLDDIFGAFRFGRASRFPDLFEQVWVNTQGKKHEAVAASVVIAVVNSNTATRGLFEEQHLTELNTHEFRAYSMVEKKSVALAWEQQLVRVASDAATKFSNSHAQALLQRTVEVRDLVRQYEFKIPNSDSLFGLETSLKRKATAEQMHAASRLAEWPGVCLFRGGQVLYETACLVLISFAEEVDGRWDYFDTVDPLREPEIMWRIQMLTDRLLRKFDNVEEYWS